MITSKEVKIKIVKDVTSEYIENELAKLGIDILHWAITDVDKEYFILNISIVE